MAFSLAWILARRELFTHPRQTSASFFNLSSKLNGLVFLVICLSFRLSDSQLLFFTTNWYFPLTPFSYVGTNACPNSSKVDGLRIPLFSLLIGSLSLSLKKRKISLPAFLASLFDLV